MGMDWKRDKDRRQKVEGPVKDRYAWPKRSKPSRAELQRLAEQWLRANEPLRALPKDAPCGAGNVYEAAPGDPLGHLPVPWDWD